MIVGGFEALFALGTAGGIGLLVSLYVFASCWIGCGSWGELPGGDLSGASSSTFWPVAGCGRRVFGLGAYIAKDRRLVSSLERESNRQAL